MLAVTDLKKKKKGCHVSTPFSGIAMSVIAAVTQTQLMLWPPASPWWESHWCLGGQILRTALGCLLILWGTISVLIPPCLDSEALPTLSLIQSNLKSSLMYRNVILSKEKQS